MESNFYLNQDLYNNSPLNGKGKHGKVIIALLTSLSVNDVYAHCLGNRGESRS